jgi:hypothetical protein
MFAKLPRTAKITANRNGGILSGRQDDVSKCSDMGQEQNVERLRLARNWWPSSS